jgi:hypothetical protein
MRNERHGSVRAALAVAVLLLGGCGRTLADNGSDTDGGATFLCAEATCSATEICVHLSCAPPQCMALPAEGCPSGWSEVPQCPGGSSTAPGCQTASCGGPYWPFCVELPAACGATPSCGCLHDVCSNVTASCGDVDGRDVTCLRGPG